MNQQAYVKRIAKSLICSKARRDEFVRDIESDIKAALAAGEPWEQIEARMGDPRQVAREFNENLSETELAAGKRRKRNKIAIVVVGIVLAVIAALALAAWWFLPQQHSAGQSIGLDEQTIVAQAEDVIEVLNADDFDEFAAIAKAPLRAFHPAAYFTYEQHGIPHGRYNDVETVIDLEFLPGAEHQASQADIHQTHLQAVVIL